MPPWNSTISSLAARAWTKTSNNWNQVWFQDKTTLPLDVIRLLLGFLLFFNYAMYSSDDVLALYSNHGLFSKDVVPEMQTLSSFSLFAYLDQDWQVLTFHYVFVSLAFMLFVGWHTSWAKWLVLIGHLSYFNRNEFLFYGVDTVAIALLLILCIAPIGRYLSLDRVEYQRRLMKEKGLDARAPAFTSRRGFACQRLIQIQMAIIYFSSAIEKLYGNSWWSGEAPWFAMANNETAFFPLGVFAEHFWLINLMAYGTILIEIAYPFLIWGYKTRPYLLAGALMLHTSIALLLGMYYFAAVMICGHLAFMRRGWYAAAGEWWRDKLGGMEMIYDGDCGFCKRSMIWFLGFDGLRQIKTRNYRSDPSPLVASEKVDVALYVVTPDNKAIPGFDAYRHVVLRVPGMWWLVPFFYIPALSRWIGRPTYLWIARNRMVLSKYFFTAKSAKDETGGSCGLKTQTPD